MKINAEICKLAIVNWTQENYDDLSQQYGEGRKHNPLAIGNDENWKKVWRTKNWSQVNRFRIWPNHQLVRQFICKSFKDILVNVITDKEGTKIGEIIVEVV